MAQLTGAPIAYATGNTTDVDSTQKHTILSRGYDRAGNEYVYLKGVANVAAGSVVSFDELGVTALLDTDVAATLVSPIAVAQAAVVADTWGWFMVYGSCQAKVLASFADNSKCFAVSTAGSVDDSGTGGNQIVGMYGRSAIDATVSGQALVQLSYPKVGIDVA